MKQVFIIKASNPNSARVHAAAVQAVNDAQGEFQVTIGEIGRTNAENALLHALLSEVSRKIEWVGERRDIETWKRLFVSAWCRAEGASVGILPALDGHGVDIVPVRTSKLTKRACADLIEFVYAWGAENGILWDEHREVGRG